MPLPAHPCLPWSLDAGSALKPNPGFTLSLSKTSRSVRSLYLPQGKVSLGFIYEGDGYLGRRGPGCCPPCHRLLPCLPLASGSRCNPCLTAQARASSLPSPTASSPDVSTCLWCGARLRCLRWRLQRGRGHGGLFTAAGPTPPPGLASERHVRVCARVCGGEERWFPSPPWALQKCSWGPFPPWLGSHQMGMAERLPCPAAGCTAPRLLHARSPLLACWAAGIFSSPTALLWSLPHASAMAAGLKKQNQKKILKIH